MKAGPELNALVSEKVMGISPFRVEMNTFEQQRPPEPILNYSQKREAAILVWNMMDKKGGETYGAFIENMPSFVAPLVGTQKIPTGWEFVPPEEICLAALKALGIEI